MGLVHLDADALCAQAGGDPWRLDDELQAGDAGAIDKLASAFHRSGYDVEEGNDDFGKAKQKFQDGFIRNGLQHPINESGEVTRATAALNGHREQLPQIAVNLEQSAVALADAQRDSNAAIIDLNGHLQELDDQMGAAEAAEQNTGPLRLEAVGAVQAAVRKIEAIRGAYEGQLHDAEAAMMTAGYVPDVLDDVDGVAGDAPTDAARTYDHSGQRARDQALADKATAEGRTSYLPSMAGRPGYLTQEEADAESRLRDYKTITDPAPGVAHSDNEATKAQASRLAAERLGDYTMAQSTGPVPTDAVLGGDARTRAQARLKLQQDLENGNLSWHQQPMTPDEATKLTDQMEASDRAGVLKTTEERLVDGGMSRSGAAAVVEGLVHGRIPEEYIEGAAAGGKAFDAGKEGFKGFAEASPTGTHWGPGVAFSAEDVEALKKFGGHIGMVGSVIELGTGVYEWRHGVPAGEILAKAAGGWAGAWGLGQVGALGGGSVGGPFGAFAGALVLGTVGAFGGEAMGEKAFKWVTE